MIAPLLRGCTDVDGVARLFAELGYPVSKSEVDRDSLRQLGLNEFSAPLTHLARHGGIDLYVARLASDGDRAALTELSDVLAARNGVIRPAVVELCDAEPRRMAIHLRTNRARMRLDVDLDRPTADVIDRIWSLSIRGRDREGDDPATLFERALDREAVGRRFFEQFKRATSRISQLLHAACGGVEQQSTCREEALRLLSRVLFVYLIQRKGWLDEDHRYLRERLSRCFVRQRSFHRDVLTPLFFDCLNTPRQRRSTEAKKLGKIPYLNGGLFEPSPFETRNRSIEIVNEVWRDVLDSVFEPFSLSVSENDDEGAHIDPEMLGRVFERLMEEEERAKSGSFYTPREVVDRLTESAIARWCAGGDQQVLEMTVRLVRGDRAALDPARAEQMLRRIERISVLDPACGSGAFLVSALRTIECLTRSLMEICGEQPPADLRAKIAASALYGVDVKMEAVRLCELRLWLAIVSVSDSDALSVPPLPNLDRNVLQGDSLVGPYDFLAEGRFEIYREWISALGERERLTHDYRRSSSAQRRRLGKRLRKSDDELTRALLEKSLHSDLAELESLREDERGLFEGAPALLAVPRLQVESRIEATKRRLEALDRKEIPFFSYELHFAHVLAKGGFSVVLGNPPWVRGSRVEAERRRLLSDRYGSFSTSGASGFRQAELAMAFVERSLALVEPDGVIAQLVPSKMTSADYGRAVRRELDTRVAVEEVVDWSTRGKMLFGADVFPLGLVARRGSPSNRIEIESDGRWFRIDRGGLSVSGPGSPWSTLPPEIRSLIGRIRGRFDSLRDVLGRVPLMGVKTGANGRFFLDDVEIRDGRVFVLGLSLPSAVLARTVRGRDLRKWHACDSTWMLWPPAMKGEQRTRREIAARLGVDPKKLQLGYVKSEHLGLKVAWKDVSRGLNAAMLPSQRLIHGVPFIVVPNQTLYSIDVATREEGLALAALLNSSVVNALALETAERAKDHHWRYLATVVGSIPCPRVRIGSEEARELVRLARNAERDSGDERELNAFVARMYGLDSREQKSLETFIVRRLGFDGDES